MKHLQVFGLWLGLLLMANVVYAQSSASASTDSTALKAYAGTYSFESGSPVQKYTITAEKGSLYGEADSMGKNKLVKQDKTDTFQSTSSYGAVITFQREASAKTVTGFSMAIQGATLTAQKDKP